MHDTVQRRKLRPEPADEAFDILGPRQVGRFEAHGDTTSAQAGHD
jgi:hypothetical protein